MGRNLLILCPVEGWLGFLVKQTVGLGVWVSLVCRVESRTFETIERGDSVVVGAFHLRKSIFKGISTTKITELAKVPLLISTLRLTTALEP